MAAPFHFEALCLSRHSKARETNRRRCMRREAVIPRRRCLCRKAASQRACQGLRKTETCGPVPCSTKSASEPRIRRNARQIGDEALRIFGRNVRVKFAADEGDVDSAGVTAQVGDRVKLIVVPLGLGVGFTRIHVFAGEQVVHAGAQPVGRGHDAQDAVDALVDSGHGDGGIAAHGMARPSRLRLQAYSR